MLQRFLDLEGIREYFYSSHRTRWNALHHEAAELFLKMLDQPSSSVKHASAELAQELVLNCGESVNAHFEGNSVRWYADIRQQTARDQGMKQIMAMIDALEYGSVDSVFVLPWILVGLAAASQGFVDGPDYMEDFRILGHSANIKHDSQQKEGSLATSATQAYLQRTIINVRKMTDLIGSDRKDNPA
ncbi:hypothetical protein OIO90_003659 [Microbotryomycetes sp. JL221]|nr:hypothetical protein OIO90_003659 [Microbotryomycetes sp. JL221]